MFTLNLIETFKTSIYITKQTQNATKHFHNSTFLQQTPSFFLFLSSFKKKIVIRTILNFVMICIDEYSAFFSNVYCLGSLAIIMCTCGSCSPPAGDLLSPLMLIFEEGTIFHNANWRWILPIFDLAHILHSPLYMQFL